MSAEHSPKNYIKIWAILMGLLFVSLIGPEFGIQWLTLVTAFGIAFVKAYIVLTRFMHIGDSPKFVSFIIATSLVFLLLFFSATAVDVMRPSGDNWIKPAWLAGDATGGGPSGHVADEHATDEHASDDHH